MNKTLLAFTAIAILLFEIFSLNAQTERSTQDIFTTVNNYLTAGTITGFSGAISVVKNGNIIINKGYGFANKEANTLIKPTTIFDIGSNTKQFTATAILKLVEQNKINLTDPLSTFFNDLPSDKQNITIHQLLTHSAGLISAFGGDFHEISQSDFYEQLFASELLFESGTSYSYSNIGYSVLARIIELTSNQSYEAFLHEHLFKPAGMFQTGYLLPKWDSAQISHGYYKNIIDRGSMISRYQEAKSITWHLKGNGGINSTQNDMLLWHSALKENKIITKESFEKLITPHVLNTNGTSSYGYGWGVKNSEEVTFRISHNGGNGIFSHTIIWYPKQDIYIVYATNASSSKVEWLAYDIAKIIVDKNYVPQLIEENIYSYIFNYIKQNSIDYSNELFTQLQENYADDYKSSRVLNTTGNILLSLNENLKWALELFKMNVQLYPQDGNLWDSLGDGYKANNVREDAITSYKKAIDLGYKDSQEKLTELMKY